MMDFPECEQFVGRKRQICRGEAGLPVNGPSSTNAYRKHWGVPTFGVYVPNQPASLASAVPSVAVHVGNEAILGRFVGTNLKLLLKKCGVEVKTPGCSCDDWIIKMNAWKPDGCVEHRQEIIEHMEEAAAELRKKEGVTKMLWTGILMMWNGIWPTIGELVDEAIWQAREAIKDDRW